jgi:hypothetical protein
MASVNPEKLKMVKELSRREVIFCLARQPNSSRLFYGGSDFKVYEVDLGQAHTSYVTGVALAGKTLVSGSYDGRLIWWDTEKRSQVRAVPAHARWIRGVEAAPDGKTIASVADDMVCRLWDTSSGKQLHELRGHKEKTPSHYPSMLFACAFTPDGKHLATADKVGHIVVWETSTGRMVRELEAPGMYTWDPVARRHSIGGIRSLAFSPDGKLLAAGGISKIGNVDHLDGHTRVEVFDWQKGERTHEFSKGPLKGLVEHLLFHPKGDWLLAAGGANDGFMIFYDLKGKKAIKQEKVRMHVHDVERNEACDTLYVSGHGKLLTYSLKG